MARDIFVIPDLHIGGGEGFQMLGAAGQARLADFGRWLAERQRSGQSVELVLAGDIVDFLAEEPWEAFTHDENVALVKLDRIVQRTRPIWQAWAELVAAGGRLIFLLGNHDIERCFPKLVARIRELMGEGQVQFVHDNQALVLGGGILIEHGNRYDGWNRVQHDDLRAIRSAFSRREEAGDIAVQPGSELVVRLMNDVKQQVAFIDLLKPEGGALVPLLVALAPDKARAPGGRSTAE
jgi:UDP-2,3-diacylglucosamine pyrophosphatase LpxH